MSLDDRTRTWQLVMTGDDLRHVTLETQADMARLLDLDPSISHLTLELGDDRVHVARDWPGDQYEEADRLIDRIVPSGVCAIARHDGHGKPPRPLPPGACPRPGLAPTPSRPSPRPTRTPCPAPRARPNNPH